MPSFMETRVTENLTIGTLSKICKAVIPLPKSFFFLSSESKNAERETKRHEVLHPENVPVFKSYTSDSYEAP